jgi:hypothetical protein
MTRKEAANTFRRVTTSLIAVEHEFPTVGPKIHGATLVLAQAVGTSERMTDLEALGSLAQAAELVSQILLLRVVDRVPARCRAVLNMIGSQLLTLAHRHTIHTVTASLSPSSDAHRASPGRCSANPK